MGPLVAPGAFWYGSLMSRLERLLFLGGIGVIAVHVIDDSFVQPNDGTSAGDHLVGSLVPLAVLALGAWWYPRARAGVRAVIALLAGALGLAVSSEAWYYTREVGASGDDYTVALLETSDGLLLKGWYVPSKNGAAVIAFPGRKGPQRQTRMLVRHGYGVLLFDRRGEGDSEGDPNALGWDGENDLRAALEFLQGRLDVDPERIGAIGLSVGGELAIQTAAHTDELQAVVSEGAGVRSVREALHTDGAEKWLGFPFWAATTAGTAVFGNKGPPADLDDLVTEIAPHAVYLIHAKRGQGGEELSKTYYESAGRPKFLWETDSSHTGGLEAQPVEYERRVIGFFDRFLLEH